MARRRYSTYAFAFVALISLFGAFQPRNPAGTYRVWPAAAMLVAASVGIGLMVLEQRAIARANRSKHLCATCNYDLSGVPPTAACPECGAGVKNVCIRCRNDMTGIEHRACPTCGVIYGTEPLSKT